MRINMDEDDAVEVQMAPLIDCVFLLLIFFLVASTLKKIEKELPLDLPEAKAAIAVSQSNTPFIISIDQNGEIYIGAQKVTTDTLHKKLQELAVSAKTTGKDVRIRIDMDKMTRGQNVVHVLDLCQFEGIKNVSFHIKGRN